MANSSVIEHSEQQPQAGQALVESLVAISVFALIWVAVHWLGNYQDMSLSATHASRHIAFLGTRTWATGADSPLPESTVAVVKDRYFAGSAHRWVNLQGAPVLDRRTSIDLAWSRDHELPDLAQPGLTTPTGKTLRREWTLDDAGVLRASVHLHPMDSDSRRMEKQSLMSLGNFPPTYPTLERSISILTGAGHSRSDHEVQLKAGASDLAWRSAYSNSQLAATDVLLRADGVDSGWSRAKPTFDWLQRWEGLVPEHLLHDSPGD